MWRRVRRVVSPLRIPTTHPHALPLPPSLPPQVNCETDFVSGSEVFQKLTADLAVERLQHDNETDWEAVAEEMILEVAAVVQENVQLRRAELIHLDAAGSGESSSIMARYLHRSTTPGVGSAGALVGLSVPTAAHDDAEVRAMLETAGSRIAMHVIAAKPLALSRGDLDPAVVEREEKVLLEQGMETGKPEDIVKKMMAGRMNKFYKEVVLLDQEYMVGDDKQSVAAVLKDLSEEVGGTVELASFARFSVGEVDAAKDGEKQ